MPARIPSGETRLVQFQALVYVNGARSQSTALPIEVAFPAAGQAPSAWQAGSWARAGRGQFTVGPAAISLAAGVYDVWARVDGTAEERIGQLVVEV